MAGVAVYEKELKALGKQQEKLQVRCIVSR